MRRLSPLAMVLATVLLVGCAGRPSGSAQWIVVEDAWVRPAPMAEGSAAAYMLIRNTDDTIDTLTSAEADFAATVELHQSTAEGEMMHMMPVDQINVPARGSVRLEPGGFHIMLMDLSEPLKVGDTVTLTLHFVRAGDVVVQAKVREQ